MFFILRKILRLFVLGLMVCGAWFVYEHRAVFNPLADLWEAYHINSGVEQARTGEMSGQVVKVSHGDSFEIKGTDGRRYFIRLTGVTAPEKRKKDSPESPAGRSREFLQQLLGTNQVRVEFTFTQPPNNIMGFVHLKETNVNLAVLESGWVRADKKLMNGLDLRCRYAFLRAARKAEGEKKGIWSEKAAGEGE